MIATEPMYPNIEVISDVRAEIKMVSGLRWAVMAEPSYKRGKVFSRIGVLTDGLDKEVWSFLGECIHPSFANIANAAHPVPVLQAGANNLKIDEGISIGEFDISSYTESHVLSSPYVTDLTALDFAELLVSETSPFHWFLANPIAMYSLVALLRQTQFVDEDALKLPDSKVKLIEANLPTMSDLRRYELDTLLMNWITQHQAMLH